MSQKPTPGAPPVTMDDSRRLDTLANSVKSCISPTDANKNILPICNASCCGLGAWEKTLKCHRIVTLDFATQNANIPMPLQKFSGRVSKPELHRRAVASITFWRLFLCAFSLALLYGGPDGGTFGCAGSYVPVFEPYSVRLLVSKRGGGKQMRYRSPAMLKLFKAIGVMNIVPRFSFLSAFLHLPYYFLAQGGYNDAL